ncbi:MAG: hypothetical protein IK020_05545 [Clostridiales bacterium]|nr:hypothetical protein [Clostridiales bacterium]
MDRMPRTYENLKGRKIHGATAILTDRPCFYHDFLVSYYDAFDREDLGLPPDEILPEEEVTKAIEEAYRLFQKECEAWKKGLCTDKEIIDKFSQILNEHFFDLLDKVGIRLGLSVLSYNGMRVLEYGKDGTLRRTDQEMWARFTEDYNLWRSGNSPCSIHGDVWLEHARRPEGPAENLCFYSGFSRTDRCVHSEGPAAGFLPGDEVSVITKERFFKLMDAFCYPIAFWHPAPPDVVFDDLILSHQPFCIRVGFSIWEDDGGLLSDNFKIGQTVTLTDHHGLKAVIKIYDHMTSKSAVRDRRYYAYSFTDIMGVLGCTEGFVGYGHIEGYTSMRDRPIDISVKDGKIFTLYTQREIDDCEAYYSFPLWRKQHVLFTRKQNLHFEAIRRLTLRFIGEEASVLWRDGKPAYFFSSKESTDSSSEVPAEGASE